MLLFGPWSISTDSNEFFQISRQHFGPIRTAEPCNEAISLEPNFGVARERTIVIALKHNEILTLIRQ